jgi:hypothetical protein
MSSEVPYVPVYLNDTTAGLSSNLSYPGFNFWYFNNNNYALGIKAAS